MYSYLSIPSFRECLPPVVSLTTIYNKNKDENKFISNIWIWILQEKNDQIKILSKNLFLSLENLPVVYLGNEENLSKLSF